MVAALIASALFFIAQSLALELGTLALPGPGFFPLALGVVLLILGLFVALGAMTEPDEEEPVELGHRDVIVTLALLMAVPLLFESLGAYLTLGAFSFLMLVLTAHTRIPAALAASALSMVFAWFFFEKMLGTPLPWGVLAEVVNR
jgi:hypothetical protein